MQPQSGESCSGQLPIQGVDFLIADIADEQWRAVGGQAAPSPKRTVEPVGILEAADGGEGQIGHAEPVEAGLLHFLRVEDQRFRIARESKITESAEAFYGDAPLLRRKIVDPNLIPRAFFGGEISAVRRPARTTQAIGTG